MHEFNILYNFNLEKNAAQSAHDGLMRAAICLHNHDADAIETIRAASQLNQDRSTVKAIDRYRRATAGESVYSSRQI